MAAKVIPKRAGDQLGEVQKEINILKKCNNGWIVNYLGTYFLDESLWVNFLFLLFLIFFFRFVR